MVIITAHDAKLYHKTPSRTKYYHMAENYKSHRITCNCVHTIDRNENFSLAVGDETEYDCVLRWTDSQLRSLVLNVESDSRV